MGQYDIVNMGDKLLATIEAASLTHAREEARRSGVPYAIYTLEGNELTHGQSEHTVHTLAQEFADDRGEAVDIYRGSRLVATVEPSE